MGDTYERTSFPGEVQSTGEAQSTSDVVPVESEFAIGKTFLNVDIFFSKFKSFKKRERLRFEVKYNHPTRYELCCPCVAKAKRSGR